MSEFKQLPAIQADGVADLKSQLLDRMADTGKLGSVNPTPFLNRAAVRRYLLDQAKGTRAHKYTRVSEQTLIEANEHLRVWMLARIARLPSMGKTI